MEGVGRSKGTDKSGSEGTCVNWTTAYVTGGSKVVISGSGRFCLDDMKRAAKEAAHLLHENKASRLLLDCSNAKLDMTILQIFYLPESYFKAGVPRSTRIALVLPTTRQPLDLYEFYETVCRNRGYQCRIFDSPPSAENWLQKDDSTHLVPQAHLTLSSMASPVTSLGPYPFERWRGGNRPA